MKRAWEEQGEGRKETKNINDFSSEGNEDSQVEMELACPHSETDDFFAHQERRPEVGDSSACQLIYAGEIESLSAFKRTIKH